MLVITPESKFLVTGANGFAAIYVVNFFPKRGQSQRKPIFRNSSENTEINPSPSPHLISPR